jgi:hypothetical protein
MLIAERISTKRMILRHLTFAIQFSRYNKKTKIYGGAKRDRTADLLLARQALSQLSYTPPKDGGPGRI